MARYRLQGQQANIDPLLSLFDLKTLETFSSGAGLVDYRIEVVDERRTEFLLACYETVGTCMKEDNGNDKQ